MVYRKRFSKKRFSRSRSTSRRRRPMGGSFMKRAKTRAYANLRTGGLLAIERKFSDLAFAEAVLAPAAGSGVPTGGTSDFAPNLIAPNVYRSAIGTVIYPLPATFTALNVLGTGDSGSDRDGRQVINDSIHVRGCVTYANSNGATSDMSMQVNIVLVLDTQTNGSGPTGGQVFVNPGDTNTGTLRYVNGCEPFVNLANSKRFRILKHIRRLLAPSSISGNAVASYASGGFIYAMDVPLKGMKTNYVADGGIAASGTPGAATTASIGDNGIFLFAWCDLAGIAVHSFNSRLRFRG